MELPFRGPGFVPVAVAFHSPALYLSTPQRDFEENKFKKNEEEKQEARVGD
jgi:hypothetical protein